MQRGLKAFIFYVCFIGLFMHGFALLNGELKAAEVFTTSADIKKVISELEFKIDPQKHAAIVFGFLWKAKEVGGKSPLEALHTGVVRMEGEKKMLLSTNFYVDSYKEHYNEQKLCKLAESTDLSLYIFFANTKTLANNPSKALGVTGFVSKGWNLSLGEPGKGSAMFYQIDPGFVYYIGDFVIESASNKVDYPKKSEKTLQYLRNNLQPIEGLQLNFGAF